jgi:hypothetical protein
MVKNTGAQATASRGYGSALSMHSTVQSGIVATESWIQRTDNADAGATAIAAFINAKKKENGSEKNAGFVFGNATDKKELVAGSGQWFRSKIVDVKLTMDIATAIAFDVQSGKSKTGNNLKTVRVFYDLDKVKIEDNTPGPGLQNAFRLSGNLRDGNNGLACDGPVYIKGDAKFQNKNTEFTSRVYIGKNLDIPNGSRTIFYSDVYVGGDATFQDLAVFEKDVYIDGNIKEFTWKDDATNGTTKKYESKFKGNVYVDKNVQHFQQVPNNNTQVFAGDKTIIKGNWDEASSKLGISGDFYFAGTIKNGVDIKMNSDKTFYHVHPLPPSNKPVDGYKIATKVEPNYVDAQKNYITKVPNPENLDPKIDPAQLAAAKDKGIDVSTIATGAAFSFTKLDSLWRALKNDAEKLYYGQLVIKVNKSIDFDCADKLFDGNVIFIVEDRGQISCTGQGGTFFGNTANGSTMIYVGNTTGIALNNFGTKTPFNGLIYIADNHNHNNSFMWQEGASINGAVHNFSSKDLVWNTGSGPGKDKVTLIHFDQNILKRYGKLYGKTSEGNVVVTVDPSPNVPGPGTTTKIILSDKPLGAYFY